MASGFPGSRYRRALHQPVDTLRALKRRFLPSPRLVRSHEVYVTLGSWTFGAAPRRRLTDIFPGIETGRIDLHRALDRTPGTSLEPGELLSLCAIARCLAPAQVVEIGTFDGNTALNLAANTPDGCRIWTVDLPPGWNGELAIAVPGPFRNVTAEELRGVQFRGADLAAKITPVCGDSATLDWSTFGAPADLVFIDGCHYYEYVRHDTAQALAHLAPAGVIVWHDYGMVADVSRAVDGFADRLAIEAVRGQRLAVGRRRP